MQPRISLITLGVADVVRARAFYERLGWQAAASSQESIAFFQLNGLALALFGRDALAEDAHAGPAMTGFSGVTIAHNLGSEAEVDAALAEAVAAGALLLKPAQKVFWGGYSGYFADPDGHAWEVAFNPFFPLDAAGNLVLPG